MRLDTDEIAALVNNLVETAAEYEKATQIDALHPQLVEDMREAWRDFCEAAKAEKP